MCAQVFKSALPLGAQIRPVCTAPENRPCFLTCAQIRPVCTAPEIRPCSLMCAQIRHDRQTLLWSATWPEEVQHIAEALLNNPYKVCCVCVCKFAPDSRGLLKGSLPLKRSITTPTIQGACVYVCAKLHPFYVCHVA